MRPLVRLGADSAFGLALPSATPTASQMYAPRGVWLDGTRLVVADSRSARDGRSIDTIGHYNPRTDPIELVVAEAKAKDWLSKGAQPSDTVRRLFKQAGVLPGAK